MQQNAPFCVLLKKQFRGGGGPRPLPTAFSLSRVGMYVTANCRISEISSNCIYLMNFDTFVDFYFNINM